MSESVVNFVPCAFVNGFPIKHGEDVGYKVTKVEEFNEKSELVLSVVRDTFYPHPDAPEVMLSVKEVNVVIRAIEGDENYSKLLMLFLAQEICKGIVVGRNNLTPRTKS